MALPLSASLCQRQRPSPCIPLPASLSLRPSPSIPLPESFSLRLSPPIPPLPAPLSSVSLPVPLSLRPFPFLQNYRYDSSQPPINLTSYCKARSLSDRGSLPSARPTAPLSPLQPDQQPPSTNPAAWQLPLVLEKL